MENEVNTQKTKTETTKIDGVSAQINLTPGSETHRRFAELLKETNCTARELMVKLMDRYASENLEAEKLKAETDSLKAEIENLQQENDTCQALRQNLEKEVADLKAQLDEANRTANANGQAATALQMKIDGMQMKENQVLCDVHPVAMHFLREMARKTGKTEGYILVDLFIRDLQNPRSNNLPYIVTSDEIRQVIDELKAKKEGE